MDHRGLVSPRKGCHISRLGRELVFSRERDAGPRGMLTSRGDRRNGSGNPQWMDDWRSSFLEETRWTGADPTWTSGPPAVIQVFTLVHEVPLIFKFGGDSRDRKDRESPLALLSPQCRRGRVVKETEHREVFEWKRVSTLSLADILWIKNSSACANFDVQEIGIRYNLVLQSFSLWFIFHEVSTDIYDRQRTILHWREIRIVIKICVF